MAITKKRFIALLKKYNLKKEDLPAFPIKDIDWENVLPAIAEAKTNNLPPCVFSKKRSNKKEIFIGRGIKIFVDDGCGDIYELDEKNFTIAGKNLESITLRYVQPDQKQ